MKRFVWVCLLFCATAAFAQPAVEWRQDFGGREGLFATDVAAAPDGGFVVCGYGAQGHAWVARLSSTGDTLWFRTYAAYWPQRIVPLANGEFYMACRRPWRINGDGDLLWTGPEVPYSPGSLGFLYMADGSIREVGFYWVKKISATGDSLWRVDLAPPPGRVFAPFPPDSILTLTGADGSLFFSCATWNDREHPTDTATCETKVNPDGQVAWTRSLEFAGRWLCGGPGGGLPDGGFLCVAYINRASRWVRFDADGDTLWTRPYSWRTMEWSDVYVTLCLGGGFVVSGQIYNSDSCGTFLAKYSEDCELLWRGDYWLAGGWPASERNGVIQASDGGFIYQHVYQDPDDPEVCWSSIIKTSPDPIEEARPSQAMPREYSLFANYPNPFNPVTTISFDLPHAGNVKLSVFDVTGRCVTMLADARYPAGHHAVAFDGSNLSSGVYFYRMETGSFRESKKMVLLK